MIKIGIECENLEDPKSRWGVGQITLNLLQEYIANPGWHKKYKLYLYFKCKIPNDEVFKNPIFIKRLSRARSFNFFYHILMPIKAMMDGLDYMFFPAYMLPPLYLKKSIVLLTGDVYWEYKHGNLPFRYRLAYGLFTNWAALRAHKILAISETSKKEVSKLYGIKPEKIFVAHLGVKQIENLKIKMQNDNLKFKNEEYILYVGQAFPRRHLKETILGFKEIAPEFPNLKLIAVGKDKYPPDRRASSPAVIDKLVAEINKALGGERIIHHDYLEKREDIDRLYAGAKSLVYVSDREAFGLPPMEALAFGVPPVIADNDLGHELFGEYAFYSKDGSVDAIAKAMVQAMTDEQRTISIHNNGPEFVRRYNWRNFADKFFENLD